MRLTNTVTIVTGAASGIGRAIAIRFAEEGANVAIADLNDDGAEYTAERIRDAGRDALVVHTDVSRSEDVKACVEAVLARFGSISILVNNAGVNVASPAEEVPDEVWRRIIGVNLDGVWFFCRYTIPHFLEKRRGVIVNIASVGAFQASHDRAPYMASKGGVVSLTRALALDFAQQNIRVNAIAPGIIETEMGRRWRSSAINRQSVTFLTPMGRFGQPIEVANAAVFLASDEASFITGHTLCVDGGLVAGNRFGREELWTSFVRD